MKKKLLSLLLALAMVFTLAACGEKKPDPGKDATATEPVVILHTNDVHGAVSNYAKVAALASQYESEGAYVLILDAGDFSQGDTAVSVSEGATAVELMNMVGYDAVALGNHEFDYGFEALKKNMENAQFPVLAANVKYNGELAFDDAAVFTTPGGTKIGVFGLDTPETATKAHPGKIQGVTFAGGEELYQIAQDMANMLREDEGCNYVICLGHLGIDDETAATGNRSIDLLNKVTGIDVFIDGHSHSTEEEIVEKTNTDRKVGDTILTSTGTKLENIGVVAIKDSTITTTCVPTEGIEVAADEAIAAGMARPMIVVMPDASGEGPKRTGRHMGYFDVPGWDYERFFFEEFMPAVEKRYRIASDKAHRAVAGLSMGGGGTAVYALHHPELFGSACSMSGLLDMFPGRRSYDNAFQQSVADNSPVALLRGMTAEQLDGVRSVRWWVDCGDDDFLWKCNVDFYTLMRERDIPLQYRMRDGGHTWRYWQTVLPDALTFVSNGFGK